MSNEVKNKDNLIVNNSVTTNTDDIKHRDVALKTALILAKNYGFSVIPVGGNKKPLISWKEYQDRGATVEEIRKWFNDFPQPGVGIVTGKLSNLVVFDIDPRHGGTNELFKEYETVSVKTGGGGEHYYFRYKEGIQNTTNLLPGIDVRGEGGYVIAPPTVHSSGNSYRWLRKPKNSESIIELPKELEKLLNSQNTPASKQVDKSIFEGVTEGSRNDSAASFIGELLNKFDSDDWESKVWPLVTGWNINNKPPLAKTELRTIFDSICKAAKKNGKKSKSNRKIADVLIDLVLEAGCELYLDENKEPHITFPDKPIVGYSIKSGAFRKWLSGKYWKEHNKGFSTDNFSVVIATLEGKAFHENNVKNLYNRVAKHSGSIFYDLGDDCLVVKVDTEGWTVQSTSPVIFRRFNHQKKQIQPKQGGNLNDLLSYVNLVDSMDKLLFLTYVVTALVPDIPRVVITNIGDQGSAKSTALKVVRELIDPSITKVLSPPTELMELAQAANHHYCLYLDNLSTLSTKMSDALCGLVTGIGFSKRRLFTDDEDVLFNQKVAIGITGINLVAEKADLLDRSLILQYQRIPDNKRLSEKEFWKRFEDEKPYILGALFSTLAKTLEISETIKLKSKPRMADYARYAASAAIALGNNAEDFIEAFNENINRQNRAALESSSVAQVIIEFMKEKHSWKGASSDLHAVLRELAEKKGLQIGGSDGFPKSSNWLWRRIMQVRPNLSALGIKAIKKETADSSIIILSNLNKEKNASSIAITATNNGSMATVAASKDDSEGEMTIDDAVDLFNSIDITKAKSEDFANSNYYKGSTPEAEL